MTVTIGRRELLAALGGAVAAWPAGLEGPFHTAPLQGSLGRRTELCEDFDHHIEFSFGIIPVMHVNQLKGDLDVPFGCQNFCFSLS